MDTVKGPDRKEERIERMVNLYQLPLLRLCIMYLHDEEQAKDAVQETFIKAYRNMDSFRADASEKTWLTRIAINTCKNVYRSGWFRHVERRFTAEEMPERAADAPFPDGDVSRAVAALPARLRTAVLLRYYQGLKLRETAAALGLTEGAVRRRLSRANGLLRQQLKEWYFDEE